MDTVTAKELELLKQEFLYELEFGGRVEGTPEETEAICGGERPCRGLLRRGPGGLLSLLRGCPDGKEEPV